MVKTEDMTNGEIAIGLESLYVEFDHSQPVVDEAARRLRMMNKIIAALREHHAWQCEAEDLTMTYTDSKTGAQKTLNISQEYFDSSMYERTVSALADLKPKDRP